MTRPPLLGVDYWRRLLDALLELYVARSQFQSEQHDRVVESMFSGAQAALNCSQFGWLQASKTNGERSGKQNARYFLRQ